VQATIMAGENAIQFFRQRNKFLVVVFNCNPRTEFVNLVTFFLVHGVAKVLQDWQDQVCSMSNAGKAEVPAPLPAQGGDRPDRKGSADEKWTLKCQIRI
jgi:hypothetical protein